MISAQERVERSRPSWPVIGLLCLFLGAAAIVVGAPWTWLAEGNWPWSTTISQLESGYEVAIAHPGKKTEFFRAPTENDAHVWLDRRNEELKHVYHLDGRIAAGRVLSPLGLGLAAAGGGVLIWGSVRGIGRRRTEDGVSHPSP